MAYIFISPHIDDAILSLGGYISHIRKMGEPVSIISVFSKSQWSNKDNIARINYRQDVSYMTEVRKLEESEVAARLGHTYYFLDFPDCPLRPLSTENEKDALRLEIKKQLAGMVKKSDYCFLPIGLCHSDHEIVRESGDTLLDEGYKIRFYEDLPYAAWDTRPRQALFETLVSSGLYPEILNIDFLMKSELIKCYASQVSDSWITDISNYSYSLNANKHFERFWTPIKKK